MLHLQVNSETSLGGGAPIYTRYRPECILIQVLEYYPALNAHLAAQGYGLAGVC
jgi:hypothetical protein